MNVVCLESAGEVVARDWCGVLAVGDRLREVM